MLLVLNDCFRRERFNLLELFELVLVLLINVVQVFTGYDTFEALVALLGLRVESGGSIMRLTINTQCAFRIDLLSIEQERVIDDALADVTFHVG